MSSIGAYEAKTQFSSLLERAAAGEEITITKHGRPVARLVGAEHDDRRKVGAVIEQLKSLRGGRNLGLDWKALRDEGRR